jgi:hypothetical protein
MRLGLRITYGGEAWNGGLVFAPPFAQPAEDNPSGGVELGWHSVYVCPAQTETKAVALEAPTQLAVQLPDDQKGGHQTRRMTTLLVSNRYAVHRTWNPPDPEEGFAIEWQPLPTSMRVRMGVGGRKTTMVVLADISLFVCNSDIEFRIVVDGRMIGYFPFKCPPAAAAGFDNTRERWGSASFHGVSHLLEQGIHIAEVQYRLEHASKIVFPNDDYLGVSSQERRLTVFAVEHSVLFEVPGSDDVALGSKAIQSSTTHGMGAQKAVDGNVVGEFRTDLSGSVPLPACTQVTEAPWLQVDLEKNYSVHKVEVYTAFGSNNGFGQDTSMSILDEAGVVKWTGAVMDTTRSKLSAADINGKKYNVLLDPPVQGRYVKLQRLGHFQLCIAELLVYDNFV